MKQKKPKKEKKPFMSVDDQLAIIEQINEALPPQKGKSFLSGFILPTKPAK